ncbi:MAG: hypothetical protein ACOVP1_00250 [Bacteroidia bacterium]
MKTRKILSLLLLLFFTQSAFAQSREIDSLICKSWKFVAHEQGGKKVYQGKDQKDDRIIFYENRNMEMITEGEKELFTWYYDEINKQVVITDKTTKARLKFGVLKLNENELILESKIEDLHQIIYLVPDK